MNKLIAFLLLTLLVRPAFAQHEDYTQALDSLEKTFKFQYGTITMRNGIGTITVPKGFKYLEPVQAEKVLTEIWNNPRYDNMTMGFILPEKQGVLDADGYVFNIQYDEIGYVKDDDAEDIDYTDLLKQLQEETETENEGRTKEGYAPISLVGWASAPYYDSKRNILHWAKELKFGADSINTLNYNVRVLGRKGVLVLNAISDMRQMAVVKADIPKVLNIVNFNDGYKYSDFNPDLDEVAAWTLGGLVAGKVLAKVGFFALLLKFWKVIALGAVAAFGTVKKFFGRRRKDEKSMAEHVDETEAEPETQTIAELPASTETEESKEPV